MVTAYKAMMLNIPPSMPAVCGMLGLAPGYSWSIQRLQAPCVDTNTVKTCTQSVYVCKNDPISHCGVYIPRCRDLGAGGQQT